MNEEIILYGLNLSMPENVYSMVLVRNGVKAEILIDEKEAMRLIMTFKMKVNIIL